MKKPAKSKRPKRVRATHPRVMRIARQVSRQLTERGIAHALIGGLAIGHHGYDRATSDVDFLVSRNHEYELGGETLGGTAEGKSIRVGGVAVDFLFPPEGEEHLEEAIVASVRGSTIPVLGQEALVCMKLALGRAKDAADVVELIKRGRLDRPRVRSYLERYRPDLAEEFDSLALLAEHEED